MTKIILKSIVSFNVTKVIKIVEAVLKKILNVGKLTEEGSNWLLLKCFTSVCILPSMKCSIISEETLFWKVLVAQLCPTLCSHGL